VQAAIVATTLLPQHQQQQQQQNAAAAAAAATHKRSTWGSMSVEYTYTRCCCRSSLQSKGCVVALVVARVATYTAATPATATATAATRRQLRPTLCNWLSSQSTTGRLTVPVYSGEKCFLSVSLCM